MSAKSDMVEKILEAYKGALKRLPIKNTIVFESNPEFSCNTYPVYRYLIDKKHIDDKYKIVWLVADPEKYKNSNLKNTEFLKYWDCTDSVKQKLKYHYIMTTSKALIYCNRLLGKNRKDQFSFCLQHGMPLKRSNGSYCIKDDCDYCLCVSHFFADIFSEDFKISKNKMVFMGFPRTDYLYTDRDVRAEMGISDYDKVIVWLPTYRQHTAASSRGFNIETTNTGIPAINTEDEIKKVDSYLRENNILLILKPHPVQKIDKKIQAGLTNFKILTNDDLDKKNIQLYELLAKTDALVTDYSSVYYDYLLTDKPIGLTVDDFKEYIKARGFVYENPQDILKGEYINDTDELIKFFEDVKNGVDPHLEERTAVKNKLHEIHDGSSAEKIGEFIISHI